MDEYIDKVAVPQVQRDPHQLRSHSPCSGGTRPSDMNQERADKLLPLLKLQPGIIHNNRLGGGYHGDTETPEQYIPATGYPGRDWETCMTMNDTWGFKSYDHNWKIHRDADPQPGRHRQQGRQLPAQRRPDLRGPDPAPSRRAAQARSASG